MITHLSDIVIGNSYIAKYFGWSGVVKALDRDYERSYVDVCHVHTFTGRWPVQSETKLFYFKINEIQGEYIDPNDILKELLQT